MTPVDLYLRRLTFWIPADRRDRIVEEIRNAILDSLDAAAHAAGRPLSDTEIELQLKAFGSPVMIAARYLEGGPVISGMLAFFYWRVLKIALSVTVMVQAVVLVAHATNGIGIGQKIGHAASRTAVALLIGFACVTLTFMALERWHTARGR
jgi:hypothetical protein